MCFRFLFQKNPKVLRITVGQGKPSSLYGSFSNTIMLVISAFNSILPTESNED